MDIKLYNTLSKSVDGLQPLKKGVLTMYSCGPTVYNNLHIGNLAAFIYADTLRRVLTNSGLDVSHVMNITDVDDKTIKNSKIEFPNDSPQSALQNLTDKYTGVFKADLKSTGCDLSAIQLISAVDSIPEMITMIQKMLDRGFAYPADDGIYFSIKAYVDGGNTYGRLQAINASAAQARISNDEYDKDSASDFALWKKAEDGEPNWQGNFIFQGQTISMPGRPGWHIECSAMSEKLLGVPFDIHTGGIDLKFPHHENEIAQTQAASGAVLSNVFFHNSHVLVEGKKMSKSLNNFYTLRDVENAGYSAQVFRLLVLESHYRSESNFSWEILDSAQNRLKHWQQTAALILQPQESGSGFKFSEHWNDIFLALQDDLNTPEALKGVDQAFASIGDAPLNDAGVADLALFIDKLESTLGISLRIEDITAVEKELIKERQTARENKDWERSDQLRDELLEKNIALRDTAAATLWYRV